MESLVAAYEALLHRELRSVTELEAWLADERSLNASVSEGLARTRIAFFCDTEDADKRAAFLQDQTDVQPVLSRYQAALDRKFCDAPCSDQLDERTYGLLRRVRRARIALFREENLPLATREQALVTRYREIMARLTVAWEGGAQPYPFAQALTDSPDPSLRERAWRAMAAARAGVKDELDALMTELIRLRHHMAQNAGFANYRDYSFAIKQREYTPSDCFQLHAAVAEHVVPIWDRLQAPARPWDLGSWRLPGAPYARAAELTAGVSAMLRRTDADFAARFASMLEQGLMDLEPRPGKQQGAFCDTLDQSRQAFLFANFAPSFTALIALIHEFGHALHAYAQFDGPQGGMQEFQVREEICELFSHGLELLLLEQLDEFYPDPADCREAQRAELQRTLQMLINPVAGDAFQHWLYTHPDHTPAERDAQYLALSRRYLFHPVDLQGLEAEVGASWAGNLHFFAYPFYKIEYAMSMLGAVQLLQIYAAEPARAIALYKQGAGADPNHSIGEVYQAAGLVFDFSAATVKQTAGFVAERIAAVTRSRHERAK